MARGESEAEESKGGAVAIWAVCAVACLAGAWVVAQVTADPQIPDETVTREPHPGIEGPLHALWTRGCRLAPGPHLGATSTPSGADVDRQLTARGYVRTREPSAPQSLPWRTAPTELAGTCGVVAAWVEPGGQLDAGRSPSDRVLPCEWGVVVVPTCGSEPVTLEGHGDARVAVYGMPGALPLPGVAPDLVLAHAEAETLLARSGWAPLPEGMAATQTGAVLDPLPEHPRGGCVPWVVAGVGLGRTFTQWLGRRVTEDHAPDRFLAGVVVCGGSRATYLAGSVPVGNTPQLLARPYRMGSGPSASVPTGSTPLRLLAPGDPVVFPDPVPDQTAP